MFKSLFGGPALPIERAEWHPDIHTALDLFARQAWSELSLLVSRQSVNSGYRLITALGARSDLNASISNYPRTPSMLTILGGVGVGWAWRHRGFGTADEVDEERWPRFYASLEAAHDLLDEALALRGANAIALAFLGRVLTGLNEVEELREVEQSFDACDMRPLEGCTMFLQARSPKWHGEEREMFAYARQCAEDDRLHPGRFGLLARAHVEKWLFEAWMQDDPVRAERAQRYMTQDDVAYEIATLNSRFNETMARDIEAQADQPACQFAHDNLGFALYLSGQRQEAARHVDALEFHPGLWPWVYSLGDPPADEWGRLRKSLGLPKQVRAKG